MAKTPFSNSMEDGNYPDAGGAMSGERTVVHNNMPDLSSGGAGGDSRPVADNGTQGKTTYVHGGPISKVDYPLPPDPNAPHGDDGDNDLINPMEMGVVESKEVGHPGNFQADYGMTGEAGGGIKKNINGTNG